LLRLLHDVGSKNKPSLQDQQNNVETSRIAKDRKGGGYVRRYHCIECTLGMAEMQQQGQWNGNHATQRDEQRKMCHRPQLRETKDLVQT